MDGGSSGGAVGEQDGDAVDDGIAAVACGAEDEVGLECERLAANGADEPLEIVGREGHRDKVLRAGC